MTGKYKLLAKTTFGFEDILAEELRLLGAENIEKVTRAVTFEGDDEIMYRANLWSRVALRILKPVKSFPAGSEQQLYDEVRKIDWSQFISVDDTLAVDGVVSNSVLNHSLYVALKTKDAIVDQFRDLTGKRPSVDTAHPTVRINVHISRDVANISLDSSGDSLHKRGYRNQTGEAPINETLAAGMVILSGWDRKSPLIDFMCGSGTILIEAALMARNIAPGIFRNEFGFQRWKEFDNELWEKIREEAKAGEISKVDFPLTGIEKFAPTLKMAKENAGNAKLADSIRFQAMTFEEYTPEAQNGTVIINPPYGGRITDQDLLQLYKTIGDNLKKKYKGFTAWILTANKEAAKSIGLKPSRKIELYNGSLECRFLKFELYEGTRKKVKEAE
ncbi:MAG: THUMP domain-containing protein [Bacteroidetes bacterium]|nr:THUMP domain-containing protein [Bacteroidota bacterium]